MRMIADGFILDSTSMGAPGIDEGALGSSRYGRARASACRATVLESRPSASRPAMGLTKFRYEVIDEAGAKPAEMTTTSMFGPPSARSVPREIFRGHPRRRTFEVGRHTFTADKYQGLRHTFRSTALVTSTKRGGALAFPVRCAPPAGIPAVAWMRADGRLSPRMVRKTGARRAGRRHRAGAWIFAS